MSPRDIAAAYDRWSATYDDDSNATRDLDALVLRASGLSIDGRRVLELGAGTGKNTAWLAERALAVTALDFSEGMLARARRRVSSPGATFVRCDLRDTWPVADGWADVVVGNLVLEHIDDCAHVFAEAARVLAVGGEGYFAELHPERQRRGGQAQFTDADTGERVRVAAFQHTIEEFRSAGAAAGLGAIAFTDHSEASAAPGAPPRLLVMRLARS